MLAPLLLLLLLLTLTSAGTPTCEEHIANKCWLEVTTHLDCLLNPRTEQGRECERPSAGDLCGYLETAMHCTSLMEVVESGDCQLKSARENFDFWVRGLEAVYTKLCIDGLMRSVVSHAACWDSLRFTRCVQHSVEGLQHVTDLASLPGLDTREHCHLTLLRAAKCAALDATMEPALAELPPNFCVQTPPVDIINDLLAAYFSASECGGGSAVAAPCPPAPSAGAPAEPELSALEPEPVQPQLAPQDPESAPRSAQDLPQICASASESASAAASVTPHAPCALLAVAILALIKFA